MKDILFIEPVFKETIWGGDKLEKEFGYKIPSNKTGECWGISAHKSGDCNVINMPGYTLSQVWEEYHELMSDSKSKVFPILVKIIDACQDLSIQVHPDNEYAARVENTLGKHECWYILPSDKNASLVMGHNASTLDELKEYVEEKRYDELLRVVPVHNGDFYDIPAGTIHAIKAGCLLYESQQSSDITYRFYDYDRKDANGNLRELHVKKALDVTTVPQVLEEVESVPNDFGRHYLTTDYFEVDKWVIHNKLETNNYNMLLCTVIVGEGEVNGYDIIKGDHFIIPKCTDHIVINGTLEIMVTSI